MHIFKIKKDEEKKGNADAPLCSPFVAKFFLVRFHLHHSLACYQGPLCWRFHRFPTYVVNAI